MAWNGVAFFARWKRYFFYFHALENYEVKVPSHSRRYAKNV